MSKKANPGLIGLFVLGAVAMMVAAVLLFGSGALFTQHEYFNTYFEGSVTGLKKGSPVLFRGVPMGRVDEVFTTVDSETLELNVTVVLEVEPSAVKDPAGLAKTSSTEEIVATLIERGLRTKLISESLVTGQLAVEFNFYPKSPIVYRGPEETAYLEIPSVPSDFQRVQQAIGGFAGRIAHLEIEELLATLTRTLETINRLGNSERIENILVGADRLFNSEDTHQLATDLRSAAKNLDATLVESRLMMGDTRQLITKIDAQVEPLAARIEAAIVQLEKTLATTQESMDSLQGLTGEDSALVYQANETLEETEAAMRSLRELLDVLERNPEALLRGKKAPKGKSE